MSTEKTTIKGWRESQNDPRVETKSGKGVQPAPQVTEASESVKSPSLKRIRALLFGREPSAASPVMWVREGLPATSFRRIQKRLKIGEHEMLTLVGIRMESFKQWRQEHSFLNPVESDRLYRLAKIEARAVEVFEDEGMAASWLKTPNRALGEKPISLLDTDAGTDMVERLLTRIEYGVYS